MELATAPQPTLWETCQQFIARPKFWLFLFLGYLVYSVAIIGVHGWGLTKFGLHGVPAYGYPDGTSLEERRRLFDAKEQLDEWLPEKLAMHYLPIGITGTACLAGLVFGIGWAFRSLKQAEEVPLGFLADKLIILVMGCGPMILALILGAVPVLFADLGGNHGLLSWMAGGD